MFQIIDLVLYSPIGAFVATLFRDTVYFVMILSECEECGFEDLGKLLIGGIILAALVGITASLLWRRAKERGAASTSFVSITSTDRKQ